MIEQLLFLTFPFFMIYGCFSDLFTMKLTNRLCAIVILTFFIFAFVIGMPWMQFLQHLLVFALALIAGILLFATGTFGAGDAKFIAATMLWFGWYDSFLYILLASILGGGLTIAVLYARGQPLPQFAARIPWVLHLHSHSKKVPYGLALGIAAFLHYPQTAWFDLLV